MCQDPVTLKGVIISNKCYQVNGVEINRGVMGVYRGGNEEVEIESYLKHHNFYNGKQRHVNLGKGFLFNMTSKQLLTTEK